MPPFRSLRVSLNIALLSLSLAVLFVSGGSGVLFNFLNQQTVIANQQRSIAKDAANSVKGFIGERLGILSATTRVANLSIVQNAEQKLVMSRLLGLEPTFRQLVLLDVQGRELAAISRLSAVIPSQLKGQIGEELFSFVSKKKNYIGPVYVDERSSEPMAVMAVPVLDAFGDFKGALAAEVSLKFMWDLVANIKVGETGTAYVVNEKGDLIAFSDVSRVLKGENLTQPNEEAGEFVESRTDSSVDKDSVDISTGIYGTKVVSTFVPLGVPDWAVIVEMPIQEAYKNVIYEFLLGILIFIIGIIAAIWVSTRFSKKITEPVIELRDTAKEIAKGKLDTKIEVRSRNEIGEVARAFNEMAAQLKESYGVLEQKVLERTKELEVAKNVLEEKLTELERMNKIMTGRELKVIELKKEIEELEKKLGGA